MHKDQKGHVNIEAFQIEEQEGSNNIITFDGQDINNRSEDKQVCI
jgi:hypothetical protein